MKIKEIEKTVTVAWSPSPQHPILLAAGTAAQQLDASFNTSAELEIYTVDLGDTALDMKLCASVNSNYRFHKIVWGSYGYAGDMEQGYIVGGCDSGNISIYSASKIFEGENGLVTTQTKHTGPVRAMDFNSFQKNLLATGASNSEIFIWDMNSTKTPMTPGAATQPLEDIVALSWNKQVQHILGTVYSTRCVVWDLRKNEPIIKLTDSVSKIKWKDVAWNPEIATQLCLASEDDSYPVLQMWDLRFATSPIKTFEGHQKGVLSLSWCEQDADMLISCGKDNKLIVWNSNSNNSEEEKLWELCINNQWNFEVSWCPRNPYLVASSSFDGHASIYSLAGGQPVLQTSSKIADSFPGMNQCANTLSLQQQHQQHPSVELRKPPKWMKKPCGVSFAFGGKLVSFESSSKSVYVSQVIVNPDILARAKELDDVIASGGNDIVYYCYKKAEISTEPYLKEVWQFLSTQFFKESTKPQMCRLLGTSEHDLEEKINTILDDNQPSQNEPCPPPNDNNSPFSVPNSESNSVSLQQSDFSGVTDKKLATKSFVDDDETDADKLIRDALLLGKIELAVELCLKQKKLTDAIILATAGGPELLMKVQSAYFEQSDSPFSNLISAVVLKNWYSVVETCDLKNWKQILVALLTYTTDNDYESLCDYLGKRLELSGDAEIARNSLICYICSGNINQLIHSCKQFGLNDIQELAELTLIMKESAMSVIENDLALLMLQYGELLASEGFLNYAVMYLDNINDDNVAMLRERAHAALGNIDPYIGKQEIATVKPTYFQPPPQPQPQTSYVSPLYPPKSIVKPYSSSIGPTGPVLPTSPTSKQAPPQNFFHPTGAPPSANSRVSTTPPRPPSVQPPPTTQPSSQYFTATPLQSTNQYPSQNSAVNYSAPQPPTGQSSNPYETFSSASSNAAKPSQHPVSMYNSSVPSQAVAPPQQLLNRRVSAPSVAATPPQSASGISAPNVANPQFFIPPTSTQNLSSAAPVPPTSLPGTLGNDRPMSQENVVPHGNRNKYLVDPSVSGYRSTPTINNNRVSPAYDPYAAQTLIQNNFPPIGSTLLSSQPVPTSRPHHQEWSSANPTSYAPSLPTAQQPQPPPTRLVSQTTYSSGWNDPPPTTFKNPALNSQAIPPNPITQPIPGSIPQNTAPSFPPRSFEGQQPPLQSPPSGGTLGNHIPQYQQNSGGIPLAPPSNVDIPPPQGPPIKEVKPKLPMPEEHIHIQTVFDELRNRCYAKSNNPQMKRKMEDVYRKLEMLYDAIREAKLSPQMINGLHQIIQNIQHENYQGALAVHSQLVSGPEFSLISSFMPGIRVLLQSALQMEVFL